MAKSAKNGKIEFFRFVFCIIILLFHCGKQFLPKVAYGAAYRFSLFSHGAIGVEFFFLVSGWLMAKAAFKSLGINGENISSEALAKEYGSFMKRKYMSIFPQHAAAFVITVICYIVSYGLNAFQSWEYILGAIPNLFLFQMSGVYFTDPNHIEWYISAMLISMAIIYPLLRKKYFAFTRWIAPILALLIVGYLTYETGSLTGVLVWQGLCFKSLLRAFADIALGCCCFEYSRYLSNAKLSKGKIAAMTIGEILLFALCILFALLTMSLKYEAYALIALFFMVAFAFSGRTAGAKIFNNGFFYYLGKLSLPIYLTQLAAIYLVDGFGEALTDVQKIWLSVLITFVFAYIVMFFGFLLNLPARRKNK